MKDILKNDIKPGDIVAVAKTKSRMMIGEVVGLTDRTVQYEIMQCAYYKYPIPWKKAWAYPSEVVVLKFIPETDLHQ